LDSLANPGTLHLHIQSDTPVNLRKPHHHMECLANLGISLTVHLCIRVHSVLADDLGTYS
jgi:hypothetical protein